MEDEINYDVCKACNMVSIELQISNNYSQVYLNSNENLERLFENFSVKDKDVLTVLASSDQYFRCLYNGAKTVDAFDVNKFTKYYYYVRKWYMEIKRKYALGTYMVLKNDNWIHELLPNVKVTSTDEEYAYKFWKKYMEEKNGKLGKYFFHLIDGDDSLEDSVDTLIEITKDKPLNFRNIDICEEVEINRQYDIIILSNILEWNAFEPKKLNRCKNNLEHLLKKDGKIICSCVLDKDINSSEIEIFQNDFTYEYYYWQKERVDSQSPIQGYCYQKNKKIIR